MFLKEVLESTRPTQKSASRPRTRAGQVSLLLACMLLALVAQTVKAQTNNVGGITATQVEEISGNQVATTLCNTNPVGTPAVLVNLATYQLDSMNDFPVPTPGQLSKQVIFDFVTASIPAQGCVTLIANTPPTCFQADAFVGGPILRFTDDPSTDPSDWPDRILAGRLFHDDANCDDDHVMGRFTGGGSVFTADGTRVTHGFELHCDDSQLPNNIEINFAKNKFHLDQLLTVDCTFDPATNTHYIFGVGSGSLNGVPGATLFFNFSDAGEPGKGVDFARYAIWDSNGALVLDTGGLLDSGNHQFHAQ
jgi:hypothetical protein